MKDSHKKSALKSIMWRVWGVIFLAAVTYFFTGNWITTTWVTVLHHGVFLLIYYLHERAWMRVKRFTGFKRKIVRVFTYEIILGQGILGLITYALTGSLQQMTSITITYIWNKIWMYVVYDYLWEMS